MSIPCHPCFPSALFSAVHISTTRRYLPSMFPVRAIFSAWDTHYFLSKLPCALHYVTSFHVTVCLALFLGLLSHARHVLPLRRYFLSFDVCIMRYVLINYNVCAIIFHALYPNQLSHALLPNQLSHKLLPNQLYHALLTNQLPHAHLTNHLYHALLPSKPYHELLLEEIHVCAMTCRSTCSQRTSSRESLLCVLLFSSAAVLFQ